MSNCKILRQESFDKNTNKHFEGAFTQGNGYLDIRGSFEEDFPEEDQKERYWRLPANVTLEKIRNPISKWGIYLPGVYGIHPVLGEEIVNIPYLLGINLYQGQEKFSMGSSDYQGFERTLNMEHGMLTRKLKWNTQNGAVEILWERYLSMENPHLILQKVSITPEQDMELTVESFLEGDVTTNGYSHVTDWDMRIQDGLELSITLDSGQTVGMKTISRFIGTSGTCSYETEERRMTELRKIFLEAGQTGVFEKRGMVVSDIDENAQGTLSQRLSELEDEARKKEFSRELEDHKECWKKLWQRAEVQIQGDDRLSLCLNFSMYHLLRSACLGSYAAIDAKGFAGEAYYGHYFWDTEIYLLPFFCSTWPEQAKRLVQFRYRTLQGARENAKRYGYPGARYPWESCTTGMEQCSNWQYADLEVHVTADVVFGIWQYCHLTKDTDFLKKEGLEIMLETARYWAARVEEREDGCHLNGVMGPDEYLPFTNDNAYTNRMVSFSLEKTLEVLRQLSEQEQELLGVTKAEKESFLRISRNLLIPMDKEKNLIWQCQDFDEFEEISFEEIWTDRSRPFGCHISQEKNYRSKALKQADVGALLYLFGEEYDQETMKSCMEYYEPYTTHDSSLSYIIHSLLYGYLGEPEKSYKFMEKSMGIDWENQGASEGIHIANAGGLWQGVIKGMGGFCGIDDQGTPVIHPNLPEHIQKLTYRLCVWGIWYEVTVEQNQVQIERMGNI